jgi:hypothetical protein
MSGDYEGKAGNLRTAMSTIYSKNGLKGFYHGYTATMCSVIPFIAMNMT